MPDSSSSCGELIVPALTTTSRAARAARAVPPTRIAHTRASLAVEQQPLGQRASLDMQVLALADRVQIAMGRAHPATVGDRRLAHGDAILPGTVVVGVVRDPDLARRFDQCLVERIARLRVRDAQRAVPAAKGVIALAFIAFHALEEGQDVPVAPAPVAHLRPGIEILGLPTHERVAVDRAGAAEQPAARHRQLAAVRVGLGLRGIQPVGRGIVDQLGVTDRNARPGMAGGAGLQQQDAVARICRKPVGDDRAGRSGADDDVVVGLTVACVHLSLPRHRMRLYANGARRPCRPKPGQSLVRSFEQRQLREEGVANKVSSGRRLAAISRPSPPRRSPSARASGPRTG